MEHLDNETLQRVLSRVGTGREMPEAEQGPDLQEAVRLTHQLIRQCAGLSRRVTGKNAQLLKQMEQQYKQNYQILQKMLGRRV